MPTTDPQHRFRLTPGHCLLALLAVEFLLFLSQWFRWLPKGWPVLIAVASVGVMVLGMFVWFGVAVVLGRRFQFSIRSLLLLVIVVAVPCSWLAVEMKKVRKETDVVEAIVGSGGDVLYEYQTVLYEDSVHKSGSPVIGEPPSFSWLRNLLGQNWFHNVTTVFIYSDNGLECLKELPQLEKAYAVGSQVTDRGLQKVETSGRLRKLYLSDSKVTAEGVAKLQQALPNCKITR